MCPPPGGGRVGNAHKEGSRIPLCTMGEPSYVKTVKPLLYCPSRFRLASSALFLRKRRKSSTPLPLRSECEQAKTPRGGVFVKRYPKDRKRKERAMPRHSATISAGRKRRDAALACAHSAGASPRPTRIALRPYLCLIPAVILERSEGSKRDYKSKDFAVFTYAGSPIEPSGMREHSL